MQPALSRLQTALSALWPAGTLSRTLFEILRTLGEDARSTIAGIREFVRHDDSISPELHDLLAVLDAEPAHPVQIIQDAATRLEQHGEMVELVGEMLSSGLADPAELAEACNCLLDVLEQALHSVIRLGALRTLDAATLPLTRVHG